ncbi:prepilin peptidase [Clostridium amazonitimonense]|uniref:prepilin peptidase n=1 Tax=Clostridium amazonitimonense TaxID=1499689 RepID=UPI0005096ECC|nr:A24 family peptidase [Clostridium amazonitimonense]
MEVMVFILGAIVGSFLNVCIYRIPREESISYPFSHCINCGNRIKAYDLIPILSYVFLKGRCRFCKERVSIVYPLVETLTAFIFLIAYIKFGYTFYFFKYMVMSSFFIVISFIDIKYQDVYSITVYPPLILALIFSVLEKVIFNYNPWNYILGALFSALIMFIIFYFTKGIGAGDIEIAALAGGVLGIKYTPIILILSFIFGAIISTLLILIKVKNRKDSVAFGPFIALACFSVIFYVNYILDWYIKLIKNIYGML